MEEINKEIHPIILETQYMREIANQWGKVLGKLVIHLRKNRSTFDILKKIPDNLKMGNANIKRFEKKNHREHIYEIG